MLLRFARRCTAHPNKPGVRGAPLVRSPPFAPRAAVLSIVDARTLEDAGLQTDLCVIGAGAAGIALAIELTRADARCAS